MDNLWAVLIGGGLTIVSSWLIQLIQLRETKRAEWKNYLLMLMTRLLDARQEYEQFLGTAKDDKERHAGIVGKAISVCLATTDPELTRLANGEITPHFVTLGEDDSTKDWPSRNRDAIQVAVSRLAELIRQA